MANAKMREKIRVNRAKVRIISVIHDSRKFVVNEYNVTKNGLIKNKRYEFWMKLARKNPHISFTVLEPKEVDGFIRGRK